MKIKGSTVLITGGQRVGQFVARELASAGANIAMTYLKDPAEVAPVLAEIVELPGVQTALYQLDLTEEESIKRLTKALADNGKQMDALINMASIFSPDPAAIALNDITRMFTVNAFGSILLSRWFAESARKRQASGAPIVSFIDWAIDHPYKDYDVYLSSKAALRHYLMALQTTFAGTIRVVNIHPGMILEPPRFPAAQKKSITANTPLKQIGTPEQAAKLVRTALELDFWADNVYLAGGQQWRHRLS